MDVIAQTWHALLRLLASPFNQGMQTFLLKFFPYVFLFELPIYLLILLGIIRYFIRKDQSIPENRLYSPKISCIALCYAEGDEVKRTIISLAEQIYSGSIEILAIIDGAHQNRHTYLAAKSMEAYVARLPNRILRVIPKWQRGGRVSSLNTGLELSTGEIVMALDGDTSFDNDMVSHAAPHFENPNIVGVAGSLRVRNVFQNLITRLQAIEYLLSIHASKVGLSEFNVVNNISGAFGIFRKSYLLKMGGWDSGTAEDLDLTIRIKQYFGRYKKLRIRFEPRAMGHTDAPDTFRGFYDQRLRWDGDLFFVYVRKHFRSFNPRLVGWRNMIMLMWTGLFFQIVMPFLIIAYTTYVFIVYPAGFVLAVFILIYLFYLFITVVFYVAFITMISERRKEDLRLAPFLPLIPFFTFSMRIWNGVATLKELFERSHLDSSMAPWWVLKKTKF
ncbi:MAG: glycosyltransferase family 2 protein [Deltaproteobacteria bacterium]|nr:MAG: glycosyltransferase family 2 protein [Deltaproteobacteria bacterium]